MLTSQPSLQPIQINTDMGNHGDIFWIQPILGMGSVSVGSDKGLGPTKGPTDRWMDPMDPFWKKVTHSHIQRSSRNLRPWHVHSDINSSHWNPIGILEAMKPWGSWFPGRRRPDSGRPNFWAKQIVFWAPELARRPELPMSWWTQILNTAWRLEISAVVDDSPI